MWDLEGPRRVWSAVDQMEVLLEKKELQSRGGVIKNLLRFVSARISVRCLHLTLGPYPESLLIPSQEDAVPDLHAEPQKVL